MLDAQRRTGTLCDVTIASNDNMIFNAHSAVLAASSQLFSDKLSGQNVGQVMLDLGAKSIQMLLDVLYSGISSLGPEEVIDVRLVAQSFEMEDVILLCDGAIEYDLPRIVKPDTVDQSTNTDKIAKPKSAKKTQVVDLEDDDNLIEDDGIDDPEYEPSMDMIKLRAYTGRKRGRPLGREKASITKEAKPDIVEPRPDPSILVVRGLSSMESGPRTRSRSGISKLRPLVQNILTKVRESKNTHLAPAIKIVPVIKKKKDSKISRRSEVNRSTGTGLNGLTGDISLVEEILVIENGDVDEASVKDSFNAIIFCMKNLHDDAEIKNLDVDSEQFQNQVSKSFSDILNKISQKEEASRNVLGNSDDNIRGWKICEYCSQFKGKKKGRLDFHEKYCSSAYKCFLCYKPFLSELDLSRHKCAKVQQESVCELCGKVLVNSNALKLHMKIHLNIKKHSCQFCGKRFIRKNHLDGHMRAVHTKERPYNCNLCNAKFTMKSELNHHMLKHSTDSPKYLCSCCGKAFYERYQLTSHLKSCQPKHSVKCMCSLCGTHFSNQNQLISHSDICQIDNSVIQTITHYVERKEYPVGSVVLCIVPGDATDRSIDEISDPAEHGIGEQHVIQIGTDDDQVTIANVLQNAQQFAQATEIHDVIQGNRVFQLHAVDNDSVGFQQLTSMQDLQVPLDKLLSDKIEGVHIIQGVPVDGQGQILQGASVDGQGQILQGASADGQAQILPFASVDGQIQILHGASVDGQGQILQGASVDGQGHILQGASADGQAQILQVASVDGQIQILQGASVDGQGQILQGASVDGQVKILENVPVDTQAQNVHVIQPPVPQDCDNIMEVDAVSSLQNENCLVHIQRGHIYTRSLQM
jgi:hypothetical protein